MHLGWWTHHELHKPTPVEEFSPAETHGQNMKCLDKQSFVKNRAKHWQCNKEYVNFLTGFNKLEHCSLLPPKMYFDNFQADSKEKEIMSISLGRMWHFDLKPMKRFINLKKTSLIFADLSNLSQLIFDDIIRTYCFNVCFFSLLLKIFYF